VCKAVSVIAGMEFR